MAKMPVKIPHWSSFDRSFAHTGSSKVGTITPLSIDEVDAGKGSIKLNLAATLPPLATDTFMRCKVKVESFMIPMRLLYGGFTDWVMRNNIFNVATSVEEIPGLPLISISKDSSSQYAYLGRGTLLDYLGYKVDTPSSIDHKFSALPVLAYRRVVDDWYKRLDVQTPFFKHMINSVGSSSGNLNYTLSDLPWYVIPASSRDSYLIFNPTNTGADGATLCSLAQRNFGYDYFTMATPNAQKGDPMSVGFTVGPTYDVEDETTETYADGSFTIASLRAANRLQQFAERRAYGSERWQDYCKVTWGTDLATGVAQRSIFLGSASFDVYSKGVSQTAGDTASTQNPFAGVGAQYGRGYAAGSQFIVNYNVSEPSYILVLATLVPEVRYASGIDRIFYRYCNDGDQVNFANPILQGLGNQPIYELEINGDKVTGSASLTNAPVFGYTQRYADFMKKNSQVSGILRDGGSLDSFVAQRSFSGSIVQTTINNSFLQIPTDYLDQVTAVQSTLSTYGWIFDCEIIHKVSLPLNQYSIPSLEDPDYEHQKTVWVENNGSHLK